GVNTVAGAVPLWQPRMAPTPADPATRLTSTRTRQRKQTGERPSSRRTTGPCEAQPRSAQPNQPSRSTSQLARNSHSPSTLGAAEHLLGAGFAVGVELLHRGALAHALEVVAHRQIGEEVAAVDELGGAGHQRQV